MLHFMDFCTYTTAAAVQQGPCGLQTETWFRNATGKCGQGGCKRLLDEWGVTVESKMKGVHRCSAVYTGTGAALRASCCRSGTFGSCRIGRLEGYGAPPRRGAGAVR